MQTKIAAALCAAFVLAACGGGGGSSSSLPVAGNNPGGSSTATAPPWTPAEAGPTNYSPTSQNALAIGAVDGFAEALDLFSSTETTQADTASFRVHKMISGGGSGPTCTNGVIFYSPDKNGDQNSTETQYFYDAACTEIARDLVRVFVPGTGSEIVTSTEQQYGFVPGGTGAVTAVRDRVRDYTSPSFDSNGYPNIAQGYYVSDSGFLNVGNYKTIISDSEFSMSPSAEGANTFCADASGYNALAVGSGNVFGWTGQTGGGSRTVNSDGSVTWTSTRNGASFVGPVGQLAINVGTPNTVCPFTVPMTTIQGGSPAGSQNIPVTATYLDGILQNLTITNASIGQNGVLNVSTLANTLPSDPDFINGTLTNKSAQTLANFNVDAFGDGTLTVKASGNQYVITSWHVRIVSNS